MCSWFSFKVTEEELWAFFGDPKSEVVERLKCLIRACPSDVLDVVRVASEQKEFDPT